MQRLKWTNWQDFQALTNNRLLQVDQRLTKFILQCGFTWSPAMGDSPILLTPAGKIAPERIKQSVEAMLALGFKLALDEVEDPCWENGFNIDGYLKAAWGSLGVKS